jgi:hypothetical protein
VQPPTVATGAALVQSPSSEFGSVPASTFSPFTPQAQQQIPSPLRPESRTATSVDHTRGDTQSIRSATTTGSQSGAKHPDLHEPGLNSSIIETVFARFDNGKLTSSSIIGDIALAYNPANFSSPFDNEKIRLENFSLLERVAPNPAFITPSQDTEGQYTVNLSSLGKTQVAFKYQVRLDGVTGTHSPLLVSPAYRPEPNQFSVIIQYSLNPSFALNGKESITLSNVTIAFTLEGAKASTCLNKPAGSFLRDKNLVYWQLNDITLTPDAAPEKLLARFGTDTVATGGVVEAKWEISGDNVAKLGSGLSVSMPAQSAAGGSSGSGAADPFADEDGHQAGGGWKPVRGVKRLVAGSYLAR